MASARRVEPDARRSVWTTNSSPTSDIISFFRFSWPSRRNAPPRAARAPTRPRRFSEVDLEKLGEELEQQVSREASARDAASALTISRVSTASSELSITTDGRLAPFYAGREDATPTKAPGNVALHRDDDRRPHFGSMDSVPTSPNSVPYARGEVGRSLWSGAASSMDSSLHGGRAGPGVEATDAMDGTSTKLPGSVALRAVPLAVRPTPSPPRAPRDDDDDDGAPGPAFALAPPALGGAFVAPPARGPAKSDAMDATSHGSSFCALDLAGLYPGA